MKLTDYVKKLIRDYFIIFAIIVICITVLRQIFSPDEYFELKDIFVYMICALIGDLPSLIFYILPFCTYRILFTPYTYGWVYCMLKSENKVKNTKHSLHDSG